MSYLNYISDEDLKSIVKNVLDVGLQRKKEAEEKFTKNVIDPFSAIFEASAFGVDHVAWKNAETIRQCQKTLQNHVGELHQKILGHVLNWRDLGTGAVVDLVCDERKIIAEVKNKYNTVTGGKLADQYYSLERLVMLKASQYKGYTAYFVNIIPRKSTKLNIPFTPSDKEKGAKCQHNEKIRIIDGSSFYSLVTGEETALADLYEVLPTVIEDIFQDDYEIEGFTLPNKNEFKEYFSLAYK